MKLATPRWRIPLVLTGVLMLAGLMAPAAFSASKSQFRFVTQPGDTKVNATIRALDFDERATHDPTSQFVKVELVDGMGRPLTNKTVSFKLVTDDGSPAKGLQVTPQLTDASGVATFGEGTLSISVPNEPEFSPYGLIPITVKGTLVTGPTSNPFNIWQDGDSCAGGNDPCMAKLRGDRDIYTSLDGGTLGASELSTATYYPNFPSAACPNQKVVFRASMFTNASQPDVPVTAQGVFLRSHITRADFRAAGIDFGQAHVEWCIALKTPWDNGTPSTEWHLDGNVLYVASAPACPTPNEPWRFAPCITAQFSDGAGGNITEGWIPPGDPVRRT